MEPQVKVRVIELTEQLKETYSRYDPRNTRRIFDLLDEYCKTFEDFLYVVTHLDNVKKSKIKNDYLRKAVTLCPNTLEHIPTLFLLMPPCFTWDEERKKLLRKGVRIAKDKKELAKLLGELKLI